jgi:cell division septal protein FtsQ
MTEHRPRKARRHRRRSSQSFWVTLALLALLAVLVYVLPPFHLQTVTISPTRAMTSKEIEAALPVKLGQHLFKSLGPDLSRLFSLRYGRVEEILQARFPYIRRVEARLSFPAAMKIEIEERIEVAYVAIPDGCVMLDKEGFALRILPQTPAGIPVIEGVSVTSLDLGAKLSVNAPDAMRSAVSLLGAIIDADKDTRTPQLLLPQISKIRPLADNRLYLTLVLPASGDELTVAAKNDGKQLEDMLWLRFAMDQGALDNRGKGVLDMTGSRTIFIPDP